MCPLIAAAVDQGAKFPFSVGDRAWCGIDPVTIVGEPRTRTEFYGVRYGKQVTTVAVLFEDYRGVVHANVGDITAECPPECSCGCGRLPSDCAYVDGRPDRWAHETDPRRPAQGAWFRLGAS